MRKKVKITARQKFLNQEDYFALFNEFIRNSYKGNRLKKSGEKISQGTIQNYRYFFSNLINFANTTSFELKIYINNNLTPNERIKASNYYRKFYNKLSTFLYTDLKQFDNYVGIQIKVLKVFFNYLKIEKLIDVGSYHNKFYPPKEDIDIITFSKEQLKTLIFDKVFEEQIKARKLTKYKDILVFGCTVGLRISDLLSLNRKNLICKNENYYLGVKSQKTNTKTMIKLPDYAVEILKKYSYCKTLLPKTSFSDFNKKIKKVAALLPDDYELVKTRDRRGKPVVIYKDVKRKIHYKFSDHVTAHTMRRTAITMMLNAGMPEYIVRSISGHAPNSAEFFRYVKLSQSYFDEVTDAYFLDLKK